MLAAALPAARAPLVRRGVRRHRSRSRSPGKVTKVEWANPHIFIYVDVADGSKTGAVESWALELGSPNSLMRLGWKRDSLKVDDAITVDGTLAKDGSKLANATTIVLASTGKRMLAGSSGGNQAAADTQ